MTDKVYDRIKDFALLWLPSAITLFGVIWSAWGLPYGKPILTTLTGIDAFLGAVVKYYKSRYDKEGIEDGTEPGEQD